MKRVVIGVGGLLAVIVAIVALGYLLLFSSSPDRAARAVPQGIGLYANLYLQQSTAQRTQLYDLLGRLPGFGDPASLDSKIHQLAQQFIGEQGIDYEADLRPWLGNQLAVAVTPGASLSDSPHILLLAAVKGPGAAEAVQRMAGQGAAAFTVELHHEVEVHVGEQFSWAVLEDLLIVAEGADGVRAALDADAGRAPSLAELPAFRAAMQRVAADHLGSVFVDFGVIAGAGGVGQLDGYSTAVLALVAEDGGLHLAGEAPFASGAASAAARELFALHGQPARLSDWLPGGTSAEIVVFGLQQTLLALEEQAADEPALLPLADALNQLRAIGALGMGINVDRDLLPLFDGEVALALIDEPGLQVPFLLLRPGDPAAAIDSLARMRDALVERGSPFDSAEAAGTVISVLQVPQIGTVAYAFADGVVALTTDPDALAAVLLARADGGSLAEAAAYRAAFDLAGVRGGNEAWISTAALDRLAELSGLDTEMRAILARFGALALTAPAGDDRLQIHAVITVK